MSESYIKEVPIMDMNNQETEAELINSILDSQKRLELAHNNYEYARDDLVDYYAFQIKSEQAKMNFLLKQAKERKIEIEKNKK